jgi:hypothetical protein
MKFLSCGLVSAEIANINVKNKLLHYNLFPCLNVDAFL